MLLFLLLLGRMMQTETEEINMKVSPNAAFDLLLPRPQELWQAGGATMQTIEPDPGRYVEVPFFDPQFSSDPYESQYGNTEDFRTKNGRLIGKQALHVFEIDDIEYLARVLLPDESLRGDHDLTIVDSTAWMTTPDGYVGDRDAKLVIDNATPLISIGAPFSSPESSLVASALKAPRAAWRSRRLSLAYSAEVEQKIVGSLRDIYDVPADLLLVGDSRGANIKSAQHAYAPHYGNNIVAFDTKGRAASKKIEMQDLPEVASWLGATLLGGVAVGACLLRHGRGDLLVGTGSLDPRFLAASVTGTMRSLASGETGETISWVPRTAHGHDVLYGLDSLSDYKTIDKLWEYHPDVVRKIVYSGTHAALLHPQAHNTQRERIGVLIDEYRFQKGNVQEMNWSRVYGVNTTNTTAIFEKQAS